jgi:hypothetical protein
MGLVRRFFLMIAFLTAPAFALEVINEGNGNCEEFLLHQGLPVYKDPTLFLSTLKDEYGDRLNKTAISSESPLLTTVKGRVQLMRLGPAQPFKNFGFITRLYELADPRLKVRRDQASEPVLAKGKKVAPKANDRSPLIVPVLFCGSGDPYSDTLGFVLLSDLQEAQKTRTEAKGTLPPSSFPNPIPEWKGKGG